MDIVISTNILERSEMEEINMLDYNEPKEGLIKNACKKINHNIPVTVNPVIDRDGSEENYVSFESRESLSCNDWDHAKGNIQMVVVNKAWDNNLLDEIPHIEFLDLILYCRISMGEIHTGIVIKNYMLKEWKISKKLPGKSIFQLQ